LAFLFMLVGNQQDDCANAKFEGAHLGERLFVALAWRSFVAKLT
jgi:hypothetical protein